uniref:Uncharacterized protein n=1 Tax=Oryza barthii TaxID=65489 RepID=A0A0D3FTA1_9ORYZ
MNDGGGSWRRRGAEDSDSYGARGVGARIATCLCLRCGPNEPSDLRLSHRRPTEIRLVGARATFGSNAAASARASPSSTAAASALASSACPHPHPSPSVRWCSSEMRRPFTALEGESRGRTSTAGRGEEGRRRVARELKTWWVRRLTAETKAMRSRMSGTPVVALRASSRRTWRQGRWSKSLRVLLLRLRCT